MPVPRGDVGGQRLLPLLRARPDGVAASGGHRRAEGHGQTAKELDKKDASADDDTPVEESEDDEQGGTDRGDLPKESADSEGADQSPGG